MKNFTLGLNIVLAIAVAVLFYLQFSSKKTVTAPSAGAVNNLPTRIAYFEIDSLENTFNYYVEQVKALSIKEQQVKSQLLAERNAFASKIREYQAKGQNMTQMEAAKANQDVEERQKALQASEQEKSQMLQNELFKIKQDAGKKIQDFLKEYNKNKTYAFILSNSGDIMYYKDSAYDITKDLIKGLNEKYPKKK